MKIAEVNSIFADVISVIELSIIKLLCLHFFANMKEFELERLKKRGGGPYYIEVFQEIPLGAEYEKNHDVFIFSL